MFRESERNSTTKALTNKDKSRIRIIKKKVVQLQLMFAPQRKHLISKTWSVKFN